MKNTKVKLNVIVNTYHDVHVPIETLIDGVIDFIDRDSDMKGQWINQEGNLEYEVHGSHSYNVENGKPSQKQIEAKNIRDALKAYMREYVK